MKKTIFLTLCFLMSYIHTTTLYAQSSCSTLLEWSLLTPSKKIELLQSYDEPILSDESLIGEIEDGVLKAAVISVQQEALSNISADEIEGDKDAMQRIASVGEPRLAFVNRFFIEGKIVAVRLYFYQNGGAVEDAATLNQTHYDTEEEAIAAGLDINADVNWQAQALYEWDGEKLTPLTFSDPEGRGFTWGGW